MAAFKIGDYIWGKSGKSNKFYPGIVEQPNENELVPPNTCKIWWPGYDNCSYLNTKRMKPLFCADFAKLAVVSKKNTTHSFYNSMCALWCYAFENGRPDIVTQLDEAEPEICASVALDDIVDNVINPGTWKINDIASGPSPVLPSPPRLGACTQATLVAMSAASGDVPTPSHPPNSPARVSPLRPPVIAQSPPMRRRPETMRGVPPASKPSRKRRRQPQQEEDPLYIDDNENIENNNADDVVNGDHAPEANGETQPPVLNGARQSRRKKTRRRVAERSEWDRNKNRAARLKGQPYIDYKDREVDAKHPLPRTCKANSQKHQKCFHCNEFSEDERATICREYYELGDWIRQKDYLLHREEKCEIKQRKVTDPNNQRQASYKHSFCKPDGSVIPVCQSFFLKTLGMKNDHALRAARAQRGAQGNFQGRDRRGRHPPANKTPEVDVEHARDHIRSFPVMESHYCRKSSTKKYLPAGLNQSKMYHLYKIWAKAAGFKVLGRQTYIKIFKNDFNYGFYRPKKDQCLICNKKKDMEQSNSPGLEKFIADVYQPHKDRETESLAEKQADKERSAAEQGYQSVTFDLESVLYTPCSDVSVMYYKRKLCVYNLTIYEQDTKEGFCYLWDETTGRRGANEVGSSLSQYLAGLSSTTTHLTLCSDTCGGQNRNIHISAMLLHAVCNSDHLEIIDQKFLESGHSYMEVDSMHSAIEFAKKHQKVRVPTDWEIVIQMARRDKPYKVQTLNQNIIMDLSKLSSTVVQNRNINNDGGRLNWLTTKWFRYHRAHPNTIFYKTNYSDQHFQAVDIVQRTTKRTATTVTGLQLSQAYTAPLPVTAAKKADLLSLVSSGIISEIHKGFYQNLPTSSSAVDRLPEPDVEEDDDETA